MELVGTWEVKWKESSETTTYEVGAFSRVRETSQLMLLGQDFLPPARTISGPRDLWVALLKPVIPSFLHQGIHACLLLAGRESPADLLAGWQILGRILSSGSWTLDLFKV
ncbi:hypothetical protein TIFTF001_020379 [Ficus carica]|uniref:Uncharacterized protein n=1 Tax=Ficus carica TaxID=3494 RepID=A0AA88AAM7_FICCA|nr:hypothetical protein TIFTF001_020379 [Ficus carica]